VPESLSSSSSYIGMEVIQSVAAAQDQCCRVATPHDAVLNSECCYTFHTPFTTPKGILVNLETFAGTVESCSMLYGPETAIFVRIVKARVEKSLPATETGTASAVASELPTKLGIGVEGGFALEDDKYEVISTHSVVVMQKQQTPETEASAAAPPQPQILAEVPYTDDTKSSFPETVQRSVDSILNHAGVATQQDVQAWQADDEIPVSNYYTSLPFVDNGVVIDPNPASWKCERTGATENLWLNLSDGYIGGGRKNWDVRIYL
jgi:ubiquitin carboxyl-terminal hydrolase 5/13